MSKFARNSVIGMAVIDSFSYKIYLIELDGLDKEPQTAHVFHY